MKVLAFVYVFLPAASPLCTMFHLASRGERSAESLRLASSLNTEQQKEVDDLARGELEQFASYCNPVINYFDPLNLADKEVILSIRFHISIFKLLDLVRNI